MSLLKKNILANFIGRGVIALTNFLFIPVYIYFLGIQAYGLIGFFITLQSVFFIFDAGLSTTLNRELARLSIQKGKEQNARNLVRTLEILYFTVAFAVGIIIIFLSSFISNNWIDLSYFSNVTIQHIIIMIGIAIAFQFPYSLYSGGLIGLQKQVLLNILDILMAIIRNVGIVLILWLVSPTIEAFFIWQILINLMQTVITALFLWKSLPGTIARPQFQKAILSEIFQFTIGISLINVLAMVLTQMDKIILSKMLTLEIYGYYILASSISSSIGIIVVPVFNGIFPKLSQLVVHENEDELKRVYHQSCQLLSVLVLPVSIVVILFSPEILLAWTHNSMIVENCHIIVSLLVTGTALNALMYMPYALQLANGWTKLTLYQNLFGVIILIPLIILFTNNYGAIGAASIWVILNSGYILLGIFFMHKRLLRGELRKWYMIDVGLPLIGAIMIPVLIRFYITLQSSIVLVVPELFIMLLISMTVSALLTPYTRAIIMNEYNSTRQKILKLRAM